MACKIRSIFIDKEAQIRYTCINGQAGRYGFRWTVHYPERKWRGDANLIEKRRHCQKFESLMAPSKAKGFGSCLLAFSIRSKGCIGQTEKVIHKTFAITKGDAQGKRSYPHFLSGQKVIHICVKGVT